MQGSEVFTNSHEQALASCNLRFCGQLTFYEPVYDTPLLGVFCEVGTSLLSKV